MPLTQITFSMSIGIRADKSLVRASEGRTQRAALRLRHVYNACTGAMQFMYSCSKGSGKEFRLRK